MTQALLLFGVFVLLRTSLLRSLNKILCWFNTRGQSNISNLECTLLIKSSSYKRFYSLFLFFFFFFLWRLWRSDVKFLSPSPELPLSTVSFWVTESLEWVTIPLSWVTTPEFWVTIPLLCNTVSKSIAAAAILESSSELELNEKWK